MKGTRVDHNRNPYLNPDPQRAAFEFFLMFQTAGHYFPPDTINSKYLISMMTYNFPGNCNLPVEDRAMNFCVVRSIGRLRLKSFGEF